ncbi:YlbF family regulator [Rossellomorea vietnamensis]|uniref:YlbF family regulator n=2 Tax=Rossellomorea TaxID=2837508 RepID=A0A5D4KK71_9BACI|nr:MULTISPECIES: YlbF family regulator [Rossellomorea]TYR77642.1 YlbF family regulator [Rossellomorea vietnamensis]TYS77126.1 YlbF family regulator [Rossellomorea aquimaris]
MLATLERLEIQESAEELAAQILQSDIAEEYRRCLYMLKSDKGTQLKIQEFSKMKELYEEVQRFGRYHPDYKRVMKEIRELKRDMDMDENVASFRRAEKDLQSLLDEVSVLIGRSVSENVKVPTGNPFFDSGSACGGGCGSGGSCGCS